MKSAAWLIVLVLAVSVPSTALAGEGENGEDVNPGSDVPFSVLERTTPSQDGATWALSVELDQEAQDNGTTVVITTQICLNSGVCDPPVNHDATTDDAGVYTMELTPPEDHSYVNWRIKATYADDSTENFPDGDWYKTWSSCYYDDGSYSGIHAEGDGCNVPMTEETEGVLPAVGVGLVLAAVAGAVAVGIARRA